MTAVEVRAGRWADSARMMRAARDAEAVQGVATALVFMGTAANLAEARERGVGDPALDGVAPGDLVIAVLGEDAESGLAAARAALDTAAESDSSGGLAPGPPRSISQSEGDIAIVSVPGEYAALEAHKALGAGMDVLLFSDGVSLDDEIALKTRARAAGRLVMGPGAGTAIVDGVALGFANVVPAGSVGVVAAAGTGAQEVSVLVGRYGSGVSAVLGTGGRDLKEEVGGLSMISGIERLAADDATAVLLCVSKPPAPAVAAMIVDALSASGKPAVACFVGGGAEGGESVEVVPTLAAAARRAAELAGATPDDPGEETAGSPADGYVRGLFSGGTLCSEAAAILAEELGSVASNAPAGGASGLTPGREPDGHICLDLGEEEYTRGRPHPMIDPEARAELIRETAANAAVGVLLFDVVLGYASHDDPAGALLPAVTAAMAADPGLRAVAYVLGTEEDPQVLSRQVAQLTGAGVTVAASNAEAARLAARLVRDGG